MDPESSSQSYPDEGDRITPREAPVRLLHTSDVHVGQWASNEPERETRALTAVVERANADAVELVVFAGDLFENNRVDQRVADLAARELGRLDMPAVILPGNHDPVDGNSVFDRIEIPPDVRVFRDPFGATFDFPGLDLSIWGRAHTSYADDVVPLRYLPPRGDAQWQLAVAHGHYVDMDERWRSYLITAADIEAVDRDYVALGHWDVPRILGSRGTACYSGSPSREGVSTRVTLTPHPEPGARRVHIEQISLGAVTGTPG
jgi:DNA repair protein SbcD/Mre11